MQILKFSGQAIAFIFLTILTQIGGVVYLVNFAFYRLINAKLQSRMLRPLAKGCTFLFLFMYHCEDDEIVPFAHLSYYRQNMPWAKFRVLKSGGHQLDNDLTIVADDIRSL